MTDEILEKIDEKIGTCACVNCLTEFQGWKALRVAVEEIARVPACDSNSCTTCEAIAKITTILGVKEGEK